MQLLGVYTAPNLSSWNRLEFLSYYGYQGYQNFVMPHFPVSGNIVATRIGNAFDFQETSYSASLTGRQQDIDFTVHI